ncbi:MAG: CPBP family intramembrane glutamic endopeptidase, partial [Halobacteria archaeon]|nr:CPBP family intramembrane glutamic endopeptidase [Halobacteria archaeon]
MKDKSGWQSFLTSLRIMTSNTDSSSNHGSESNSNSNIELESKRVLLFIAFSFGFSWIFSGIIYATGGLENQAGLAGGMGVSRVLVLLLIFMWGPAVGNVLTRLVTGEGRDNLHLGLDGADAKYLITAWLLPVVLVVVGAGVYFVVFPDAFDPSLGYVKNIIQQTENRTGSDLPFSPRAFVAIQLVQAVLLAPIVNSFFTFGEEFGWRAYLLPKLRPLGDSSALVLTGVVWGVWHYPIILMGYNYGVKWSVPSLLAMTWFTVVAGVILGWLTFKTESVWFAVVGHASINGVAGIGVLVTNPDMVKPF